ncbi:hypothetical protein PHJA_001636700, partial [Phtheirospermum japonicum]
GPRQRNNFTTSEDADCIFITETVLVERRRFGKLFDPRSETCFLLTALALLAFLCTIYLYFYVTLGSSDACSDLSGAQKASCRLKLMKASATKGKLKFF